MRLLDYSILLLGSATAFTRADSTNAHTEQNLSTNPEIQQRIVARSLSARGISPRTLPVARKSTAIKVPRSQPASKFAHRGVGGRKRRGGGGSHYSTRSHGSQENQSPEDLQTIMEP